MERRDILKNLVAPEFVREHPNYKILVDTFADRFGELDDQIEVFPILGSIDRMPDAFVPYLATMLGIDFAFDKTVEAQREIVKRAFSSYARRGTNESLRKAAARGSDDEWYLEELTYYTRKVQENRADIKPANDEIFKYSGSKLSGTHKIQDGKEWDIGVVLVEVDNWTSRADEKIIQVLPAGRIIVIRWFLYLGGEVISHAYESWNHLTGERIEETVWDCLGDNSNGLGEVKYPTGTVGMSVDLEMSSNASLSSSVLKYSMPTIQFPLSGSCLLKQDNLLEPHIEEPVMCTMWQGKTIVLRNLNGHAFVDAPDGTFLGREKGVVDGGEFLGERTSVKEADAGLYRFY